MAKQPRPWYLGVGVRHDPHFVIDRPQGSGDAVFLHFSTPIRLRSRAGLRDEREGACIIYTPPFAQYYCGPGEGFAHNWLHMPPKETRALLKRYDLPENTVFFPQRVDYVPRILETVQAEQLHMDLHAERATHLLMEELLLHLARARQAALASRLTPLQSQMQDAFRRLRRQVHESLTTCWRVEAMAKLVHLSPSRFAVLYREFFGVPPMEDLIQARLARARWLLTNTTLAVADVAAQSGFENIYYFSRLFHRRVGCPPREYYRRFVGSG